MTITHRNATVAVVGAGDYIGATDNGDRSPGDVCAGRTLDARQEDEVARFMADADAAAPLVVTVSASAPT